MLRDELKPLVGQAVNMLFAHDAALFAANNSEWAVAHRFAVYLERLLPGWNVDCEFNRQGEGTDPKARDAGARVRPDIIVHHRGRIEREHNLLAVELKKGDSLSDHAKVQEYTTADAERCAYRKAIEWLTISKLISCISNVKNFQQAASLRRRPTFLAVRS